MISRLMGFPVEEVPGLLVMSVNGVYYDVRIPPSKESIVPANHRGAFEIHVIHHITERSQELLGFPTREHKDLAKLLIDKVSGIGPSGALDICGSIEPAAFKAAVVAKDVKTLSKCKGVGAKTADRIVVELVRAFEKMGVVGVWEEQVTGKVSPAVTDAIMALVSLGYKKTQAKEAVEKASLEEGPDATVQDLIRCGLRNAQ